MKTISKWMLIPVLAIFFYGAACGGGGGASGGSGEDDADVFAGSPFQMIASPASDEIDVDVWPTISVVFGVDIDASTLTSDTFTLTADGEAVESVVTYDESTRTATLRPIKSLPSMAECTATLMTGIASSEKVALESDYSWDFTLRDRAWGPIEEVMAFEDCAGSCWGYLRSNISSFRETVITWFPEFGDERAMLSINGDTVNGGSTEDLYYDGIYEDIIVNSYFEFYPLSTNSRGEAVVSWAQSDGAVEHVLASVYQPDAGWSDVIHLDISDTTRAYDPTAVMAEDGTAIAAWIIHGYLKVSRYLPTEGWQQSELVSAYGSHYGRGVDVAVNNNGEAVLAWLQDDSVYCVRYDENNSWSEPERIITNRTDENIGHAAVLIDDSGIITVAAVDKDTLQPIVVRSNDVGGWGVPADYDIDVSDPLYPSAISLTQNVRGDILLAWGKDGYMGVAMRDATEGWKDTVTFEKHGVWSTVPHVGMDSHGNAMIVHESESEGLYVHRYINGSGWVEGERLDSGEIYGIGCDLSMNASGDALLTWYTYDGADTKIYMRYYE